MEWTSDDVVGIVKYLLPGFLTAWVFYGLTAHPRREPFERVVQALIFTAIVQILTSAVRWGLVSLGQFVIVGSWTSDAGLAWSLLIAFLLGLAMSACANKNLFHGAAWHLGLTNRTSYPSEWNSAFHKGRRWIVLHLKDSRRIHGWPEEWPDSAESGHFVLYQASWLSPTTNEKFPLHTVEYILIPASEVEMLELLKDDKEVEVDLPQILAVENALTALQREEADDESETRDKDQFKRETRGEGDVRQTATPAVVSTTASTPTEEVSRTNHD